MRTYINELPGKPESIFAQAVNTRLSAQLKTLICSIFPANVASSKAVVHGCPKNRIIEKDLIRLCEGDIKEIEVVKAFEQHRMAPSRSKTLHISGVSFAHAVEVLELQCSGSLVPNSVHEIIGCSLDVLAFFSKCVSLACAIATLGWRLIRRERMSENKNRNFGPL